MHPTPSPYEPIEQNLERQELIRQQLCPTATDAELQLFAITCDRTRLDPFARQIYLTKYKSRKTGKTNTSIIAGIDGFRIIAERSDSYSGQDPPQWCDADGQWIDVWIAPGNPFAAKARVLRHRPWGMASFTAIAHWSEYNADTPMWRKMPASQLAKCAEALALRKAFPNDLSGLYTADEMNQAETPPREKEPLSSPPNQPPQSATKQLEAYIAEKGLLVDDADQSKQAKELFLSALQSATSLEEIRSLKKMPPEAKARFLPEHIEEIRTAIAAKEAALKEAS